MIVIVDYGLGNLFSVLKAFQLLGANVKISSDPADLQGAERIVLPGVGAFGDGMRYLREKGIDEALRKEVQEKKKPFLGICLGLQFLGDVGLEFGEHKGLGWIAGSVRKLEVEKLGLCMPHIGWNAVDFLKDSALFKGVKSGSDFYFLHSYQLVCENSEDLVATADYGGPVTAAIERGNIFAVQFHPEKSQQKGLKILENFMQWQPPSHA